MRDVRIFNEKPLEFYGGGEVSTIAIANGLSRRGWRVDYVSDALNRATGRISSDELDSLTVDFTYRKTPFRHYGSRLLGPVFHRLPYIKDLSHDGVNLILIHRPPPHQFVRELSNEGIRTVFLVHGLSVEDLSLSVPILLGYQLFIRGYFKHIFHRSLPLGISFQVFGQRMHDFLLACGLNANQVYVIPSGVSFERFYIRPTTRFTVLFIGRIERLTKGVDFLTRVLSLLAPQMPADMNFTIIGSGPDAEYLVRKLRQNPVRSRIEIMGFIPEAVKRELLSKANLMLITSRAEPFSLVAVEGLASGVPILSTPVTGPTSILSLDSDFGSVVKSNPREFVRHILDNYQAWRRNPSGYQVAKQGRRTRAKLIFDERATFDAYSAMISDVIEKNH